MSYSVNFAIFWILMRIYSCQDCTLPAETFGTWESPSLGTVTISGSTPSLTFTRTFTGQTVTVNEMKCHEISGSKYILISTIGVDTFSGNDQVFLWMCVEFIQASLYSYYFYLHSEVEAGFDGYRLYGGPSDTTLTADVCSSTPDMSEFHTMIKTGNEMDAVNAVECPDPLLGTFIYNITDSTGTYCGGVDTTTVNACDAATERTHVHVDNTGCTSKIPFHSTGGQLGCIVSIASTGTSYASLYNLDASPSVQFICVVITEETDSTYLSYIAGDCESGQTATTLLTGGATMILTKQVSCKLRQASQTLKFVNGCVVTFPPCLQSIN
ncbi:uncharacterized protein LOC128223334 [Mya arenaria]|uniref:uncharacterized protein LOC128223334 n=1 Tax=Mya arenaria TaxID=6604 RepID=UPI0022E703E1|nr:uncharacterized protein LOC128223334 [Mya arenaria]